MYCAKCGKEIKDGARFCGNCGAPVGNSAAIPFQSAESKLAKAKSGQVNKKKLIRGVVIAVLAAVVGTWYIFFFTGDRGQIKKNMKTAGKYYDAREYQDAASYYEAVLDIDETYAEAYRMLSLAYLMEDDCLAAMQTLLEGIDKTGNKKLAEWKDEVQKRILITAGRSHIYAADGELIEEHEYEYGHDDYGQKMMKDLIYVDGELIGWDVHKYKDNESTTYFYVSNEIEHWKEDTLIGRETWSTVGGEYYYDVYDGNGNLTSSENYIYIRQNDADGNLVDEDLYSRDLYSRDLYSIYGNIPLASYHYSYDIYGNMIKKIYWNGESTVNKFISSEFQYGEDDITKAQGYDSLWEYEYDLCGSIVKETEYDGDGHLISRTEYEYDYCY